MVGSTLSLSLLLPVSVHNILPWILTIRLLSLLSGVVHPSTDDVCSSLALMYGYTAYYAPSHALQDRIDRLVVRDIRAIPASSQI